VTVNDRTPADLLRSALAADPARPLVTFYDDATGERVELSVATFANWVAKTANLLQDGMSAEPGDRVALLLPAHWQTAVWLLACSSMGVVADVGGDVVNAAADCVAFLKTTGLKRVVSGGLDVLTGPASSADTQPCICTVTRLAVPAAWSAAISARTASAGTLLLLR